MDPRHLITIWMHTRHPDPRPILRCEHCGRRLINPISRLCTNKLWHLRCMKKI